MCMNCASMRTSASEKFSSRLHFGIRACIWAANLVASPRYSRCSSCCGRSGIAADYAQTSVRTLAPAPDRGGQRLEHTARIVPAQTRIGDALSEEQRLGAFQILASLHQVRLDHGADDATLAGFELPADVARHLHLLAIVLRRVGVRAIDHQPFRKTGARELAARRFDRSSVEVRRLAAAQDDVAVLVAARLDDRHLTALVHREEMLVLARREQRVDGALDVAVGAILEADRRRQPRGELAVHLALGGAGADRAPGKKVPAVRLGDTVGA